MKRGIITSVLSILIIISLVLGTSIDTRLVFADTVTVGTPSNAELDDNDKEIIVEDLCTDCKELNCICDELNIGISSDSNATKQEEVLEKVEESIEEQSFYEKLLSMDNLDDLYEMILNAEIEEIESLSFIPIDEILDYVYDLNAEEDYEYFEDLVDTLYYLFGESDINVESIYDYINSLDNLYDIYDTLLNNDNIDSVEALSFEEINLLREKIGELYYQIENISEDESLVFLEIQDIFDYLQYERGIETYATYTRTWNGSVSSFTVASGDTYNVTVTGNTTLSGVIVVEGTLNIKSDGKASHVISRSGSGLFRVQKGGKLIITGTDGYPLVLKGYTSGSTSPVTVYTGTLDFDYVTIKNSTLSSGYGGALHFGYESVVHTPNVSLNNVTITDCKAPEGAAVMFRNNCAGTINFTDCTIKNCTSTGTYGGTIRTQGNANCKVRIESCTIKDNVSVLNGGGVYWNARGSNAHLDITGTQSNPTIIQSNSAKNGGGVFLSGQSIEIINTHIIGNNATYGGGICMQPYDFSGSDSGVGCDLNIGSGAKLMNNTSSTYGGGIYMQIDSGSTTDGEDFDITISDDALVQGNSAKYGGGFAVTQQIGNAEYASGSTRKYSAYLNINSGIICDNTATLDGGAFYVNREYGDAGAGYDLQVSISGGKIFNNKAEENGGIVYLADDASNSTACVNISGGTLGGDLDSESNTAVNGGAIYINGGSYIMSDGEILNNSASKNGGAVCVYGGDFTMSGGKINNNTSDYGGAVYINGGNVDIENGLIDNNFSNKSGGGIYISSNNNNFTVDIYSGKITNNYSGQNGGGIGIDVDSNSSVEITIGSEPCLGIDENHAHPVIENNVSSVQGGGLYLNGNESNITLDMYCGFINNNYASYETSSDNVSQTGGLFTRYGGEIGHGLCVLGGTFLDERPSSSDINYNITYHPNYIGSTDDEKLAVITENVEICLPAYAFVRDGYYLIGWSELSNPQSMDDIIYIGADYEVLSDKTLYAIWTMEAPTLNYIVYIPDEVVIDESKKANLDVSVELSNFPYNANLNLTINKNDKLYLNDSDNAIGLSYNMWDKEDLVNDGDVVATWNLKNRESKNFILELLEDAVYSGSYTDILTFVLDYNV